MSTEWFTGRMNDDEFWQIIENCRIDSKSMTAFNSALEQQLRNLDRDQTFRFHNTLWRHIARINGNAKLSAALVEDCGEGLQGDWGDCYGGWVVSQGREFYQWLMLHPSEAGSCFPEMDDVGQGERVYFSACIVWRERTGESLQEIANAFAADDWPDRSSPN